MTRKQRLNIVHTESSCGWGGQEIRILTESEGMISRGHYVHILCPKESNIYNEALKRGIPVTGLPIARKKIPAVFVLRKWLKQHPTDIINTHSSTDSWLSALATRFLPNAPKILRTRHVSAPVSKNSATRWLYTSATDYIVTTGEKLRQTLIHTNQFPAEKMTSVPTGIDANRFVPRDKEDERSKQSLSIPSDKFIVGILATIRTWKGHIYLIEAIAKLNNPDIHLLIVGDGPYRSFIEETLHKFGLTNTSTLSGNQDDVVPWLQSMDLLVLPSYANEGVPQSIMQAMLCELPVISTPVGSITEVIIDGETGVIVPAKDAQALSAAMKELIVSDDKRLQYAKQGRKHALQHCTAEKMLDEMEIIYSKLLSLNTSHS